MDGGNAHAEAVSATRLLIRAARCSDSITSATASNPPERPERDAKACKEPGPLKGEEGAGAQQPQAVNKPNVSQR